MIVTTGAAHAQAEKGLAQVVNRVINRKVKLFGARAKPPRDGKVSGRYYVLVFLGVALGREQIACDLLVYELVVWFVFIERLDDIIAILVSRRNREV